MLEPDCLGYNSGFATYSVILGELLNLSVPMFTYLEKGANNTPYFLGLLWRLDGLLFVKHLEQSLAYS